MKQSKKAKKADFGTALGAVFTGLAKVVATQDGNKDGLTMKAVMENAAMLIKSVTNATKEDIALMSTMVRASTLLKPERPSNVEPFNNSIQRYLLIKAKGKKLKALIRANMEN